MDVYSYSTFDWVVRLYNSAGTQVGFTEQYTSSTTNRPPVLSKIEHHDVVLGQQIAFTITANDPQSNAITYAASPLPAGATFDTTSGRFTWTPQTTNIAPILFVATSTTGLQDAQLVDLLAPKPESVSIISVPPALPQSTGYGNYAPPLTFGYSNLVNGSRYTLKVWLLSEAGFNCASTEWCNRVFTLDNSSGDNANGYIRIISPMDVYNYSGFDWIARLYDNSGSEIAMAEQLVPGTTNRPPDFRPAHWTLERGVATIIDIAMSDPQGGPLYCGAETLPQGAVFDAANHRIQWQPQNLGDYSAFVLATNSAALAVGQWLTFSIVDGPAINLQPQSTTAALGANVVLGVSVSHALPVSYQWQFNGTNIAGATNSSLSRPRVTQRDSGVYRVIVSDENYSVTSDGALVTVVLNRLPIQSERLSIAHLATEMDRYHRTIDVYTDVSAAGSHFAGRGQLPNEHSPVTINGSWPTGVHSGATCIRCDFTPQTVDDYGGYYFLNGYLVGSAPAPYFGEGAITNGSDIILVTNSTGINLAGAVSLSFWVKGEKGGERIDFFVGGVGRDSVSGRSRVPYPDSTPRYPRLGTVYTLSTNWQRIVIPVWQLNLTNVMGGFGWTADARHNSNGAVFYLDDIQFNLGPLKLSQRLAEPRFIRSFVTLPAEPDLHDGNTADDFDLVLRNAAFVYDNALAILAFLADRTPASLYRARLIGNAIVYATKHDRSFTDGRVRSIYTGGDLALPAGWYPNGKKGTVAMPGFYDETAGQFYEFGNADVDTGNNAWAMIALLGLYERTRDTNYLAAARRIGEFIHSLRNDSGTYRGFLGGIANAESASPTLRTYGSTEHNLDVYAAFSRMYQITREQVWQDDAGHARDFVESMWDETKGCYYAGTFNPSERNESENQLPLDTHSWAVLALTNALVMHPLLLSCPEQYHRNAADGFSGFDFNDDRDGVWFEGTGQMSVAYAATGRLADAQSYQAVLRAAQQMPSPLGNGLGLVAASHDGVSTGFNFNLYRRLHVGATAWNVFAQLRFNPYYQKFTP